MFQAWHMVLTVFSVCTTTCPVQVSWFKCFHGRLCVVILLSSEPCMVYLQKFCLKRKIRHCSWPTCTMVRKKNCNWFQSSSVLSIHALFHICYDIYTFFPVLSSIFYCKTHKTVNTRRLYYGMLLCCEKIANRAWEKSVCEHRCISGHYF